MRVVATMNAPKPGGAELHGAMLGEGLLAQGWDVHILAPPFGRLRRLLEQRGLPVHRALLGFCAVRARGLGAIGAFDLLHFAIFGYYVRRFSARSRTVLLLQDPTQQIWGAVWGAAFGVPVVFITHSPFHFRLMRLLLGRLFVRAATSVDLTITVSERHRDQLIAAGVPASRLATVTVGRDPRRFRNLVTAPELAKLPAHSVVLGCFSRLQPGKGIDVAIEALQILRQKDNVPAELLVAGTGPSGPTLAAMAREFGVADHVHFLGHRDDVPELMHSCYAVLLPSSDPGESLPAVAVEAMFARACLVSTRVGGLQDLVRHDQTGVLVDDVHPAAFARAITALIANPTRHDEIVAAASDFAERHLSLDDMVLSISALLRQVLERNARVLRR